MITFLELKSKLHVGRMAYYLSEEEVALSLCYSQLIFSNRRPRIC